MTLSISQLNNQAKAALQTAFPTAVWIRGEVLDWDKSKDRQHIFFSLVEKPSPDARPKAQVDIALFERTKQRLAKKLGLDREEPNGDDDAKPSADAGQSLTMQDGIEVRVRVKVDLYPASGRYQVIVEDIDPEFTLGKLALSREQTLSMLRELGLDRLQLAMPMPFPPLRVGLLASPDSDGMHDFMRQLEESGIGFNVTLVPVKVQGEGLKRSVVDGLAYYQKRAKDFDVVCIIRGGGSRTDLSWFDDPDVAKAVASCPIKVVVGIGHQRDRSVLDEIAWSEKTPTAVGALLVGTVMDARATLREQRRRVVQTAREILAQAESRLQVRTHDLSRQAQGLLADAKRTSTERAQRLHRSISALVRNLQLDARNTALRLQTGIGLRLADHGYSLRAQTTRLSGTTTRQLERTGDRLDQQQGRAKLLDPARVLARGYALIRAADTGKMITDAGALKPGTAIVTSLRDGTVASTVDSTDLHDTADTAHKES